MLHKSKNAFEYFVNNRHILFNSHSLKTFCVDKDYIDVLNNQKNDVEIESELREEGFLVDDTTIEDAILEKRQRYSQASKASKSLIGYLRISLTEKCNLACKYCFINQEFQNKKDTMSKERFMAIMDDFITHNTGSSVSIQYFGGEPLLRMDLIEIGNDILKKAYREGVISGFCQEIVTNGTLLDHEKIYYFKDNKIKISVSLDGKKEVNDKNRVYPNGMGSFDIASKCCTDLLEINGYLSVLLTPNSDNINILADSIKYLVNEIGVTEISINAPQPCAEGWDIDGAILAREIQNCILFCQEKGILFNNPANNMLYLLKHHTLQKYSCMNFSKESDTNIYGTYIGSDGSISACIVKKAEDYYSSFEEMLKKIQEEEWAFRPCNNQICSHCLLTNVCGGSCTMEQKICKNSYNAEKCKFMQSMLRWIFANME